MKIPNISNLIRLALLRGLMRLGRFVVSRTMAPAMRPAAASAPHRPQTATAGPGRIIDGEFRRVDPRHNNSW
jgi:hypothetical protein